MKLNETILFRVLSNPEKPPAIDWAAYQSKVAVPGLVDSFKKQYESFQVPYPKDTVSPSIDAQEKEAVTIPQPFKKENKKLMALFISLIADGQGEEFR